MLNACNPTDKYMSHIRFYANNIFQLSSFSKHKQHKNTPCTKKYSLRNVGRYVLTRNTLTHSSAMSTQPDRISIYVLVSTGCFNVTWSSTWFKTTCKPTIFSMHRIDNGQLDSVIKTISISSEHNKQNHDKC